MKSILFYILLSIAVLFAIKNLKTVKDQEIKETVEPQQYSLSSSSSYNYNNSYYHDTSICIKTFTKTIDDKTYEIQKWIKGYTKYKDYDTIDSITLVDYKVSEVMEFSTKCDSLIRSIYPQRGKNVYYYYSPRYFRIHKIKILPGIKKAKIPNNVILLSDTNNIEELELGDVIIKCKFPCLKFLNNYSESYDSYKEIINLRE